MLCICMYMCESESPFFGKHREGIPWIHGRERPRARRRTTGCVTQSPVHRRRERRRFVSSLGRRAVGNCSCWAESPSGAGHTSDRSRERERSTRLCASVVAARRPTAEERGWVPSDASRLTGGTRAKRREDEEGKRRFFVRRARLRVARDSLVRRGNLPLPRRWQHHTTSLSQPLSRVCIRRSTVCADRRDEGNDGRRTVEEFIRCSDARSAWLPPLQTRYAMHQCFPTSLP